MQLTDLNYEGGIGANSIYCRLGDFCFVIDSGLHPKRVGQLAAPNFRPLEGVKLDLVIITHCHLDHIGSLPLLLRAQPGVPVVMTQPSRMLIERMLHNSVNVMQRERKDKGIPDYPLYTHREVDRCVPQLQDQALSQPKKLTSVRDEVELILHPAGHIPGAAGVEIKHQDRRIFFTGDVLFENQRILDQARFPVGPFDTLIMENTHGASPKITDRSRSQEMIRLVETINATIRRGGSVLIPVFALGRMQEVLTILHDAKKLNRLVDAPVFASGLGIDICDYFDNIARKTGLVNFARTILKDLKVCKPPRELLANKEPSKKGIYVVSSGMVVENTASYFLSASLAGNTKNSLCFVGYCDPDTPGGMVLAAQHNKELFFAAAHFKTNLRAQVERFEFSGHADRDTLLDYAVAAQPRSIVLTHGEPPARAWFAAQFAEKLPHAKVLDPVPLQSYEV